MCCMHCVWQTSFNFLALLGDVTFSTALLNKRCFFGEKSSYFPNIWPSILESSNVARWNYCKIQSMGARVNIDCFWSLLFNNGLASTTYIISCSQKSIVAVAELCILYKHTVFNPPSKLPYPVTWDTLYLSLLHPGVIHRLTLVYILPGYLGRIQGVGVTDCRMCTTLNLLSI